jgi:hypothetical protein
MAYEAAETKDQVVEQRNDVAAVALDPDEMTSDAKMRKEFSYSCCM